MAEVEKVTVKYSRKINLGDYNQIDLSIMPTVIPEPGDDLDDVLRRVWQMCRDNVQHAARPIVDGYGVGNQHGITAEELLLGLKVESMKVEKE